MLLFTGNGKGKSTAAFGMLARALGHGMRARVIQFVKADREVGEEKFFSASPLVLWSQHGRGFLPRDPESPEMQLHRDAAAEGLTAALAALADPRYDFVLLDEVCFALSRNLVEAGPLLRAIDEADSRKIIVLTGRNAPQELLDAADTATEMTMLKHGFEAGIPAQRGVED